MSTNSQIEEQLFKTQMIQIALTTDSCMPHTFPNTERITVRYTRDNNKKLNSRQHVATSLLRDSPFTSNMMGQTKYVISHSRVSLSRWSPVPPSKL